MCAPKAACRAAVVAALAASPTAAWLGLRVRVGVGVGVRDRARFRARARVRARVTVHAKGGQPAGGGLAGPPSLLCGLARRAARAPGEGQG